MWLAGPDLTIRGMISPINLAALKVVEEGRAVMGGCVGGERRVHMSSDSDRKNLHSRVRRHKMFVPSDFFTGICIVKLKTPLKAANLAASKPKLQICSLARLPTLAGLQAQSSAPIPLGYYPQTAIFCHAPRPRLSSIRRYCRA